MNNRFFTYVKFLIKVLWILLSFFAWIIMLVQFLNYTDFGSWMTWGAVSTFFILPMAFAFLKKGTKGGYQLGATQHVGRIISTSYNNFCILLHDRRYSQAIITFILGVFVFLLAAPILLIGRFILAIIELIAIVKEALLQDRDFFLQGLKITGIILLSLIIGFSMAIGLDSWTNIKNYEINSQIVDEGYEISLNRKGSNIKKNTLNYELEVSDSEVAYISLNKLIFKKPGYVIVRAVSSSNHQEFIEMPFYKAYEFDIFNDVKYSKTDDNENEFWFELAKLVVDDGYNIISASRADKLYDTLDGLKNFLITLNDNDAYLFSTAQSRYAVKDAVICELSSWSNMDVNISKRKVTAEELNGKMCSIFNSELKAGPSINNYAVEKVNTFLQNNLHSDGKFLFSNMDSNYQYCIVLCADYIYGTSTNYYRHGLLSGLIESVKEAVTGDWESILDNYSDTRVYHEISELKHLRICIVRRKNS